jgi:hypothetical protein
MPYKDPERKRQWEQEHREERNSRRRMTHRASEGDRIESPVPNTSADHGTQNVNLFMGLAIGIASLLVVTFAMWRFVSSPDPVATT